MKKEITIQEAIDLLPNKPKIHTFDFINGNIHFWGGCDVSKDRAVEIIRTSQNVYLDTEMPVGNHIIHCHNTGGKIHYEDLKIEAAENWEEIIGKI